MTMNNLIEAEKAQPAEPVATLHDDGCFTWKRDEFRLKYDRQCAGWRMDVYASPPPQPVAVPAGFDHDIGADRFKVVKGPFWWHIRIGDSTGNVGKFHSKLAAEDVALKLLTAFRDGAYMQYHAMLAASPAAPAQVPQPLRDEVVREMLANTREVFDANGPETSQEVRDVIEYVSSWFQVYIDKTSAHDITGAKETK